MIKHNFIKYYFDIAKVVASQSRDNTKVGCVLVNTKQNAIISTGFNGCVRGQTDQPEVYERPLKYTFICHAETNAIANAAACGVSTNGAAAFITMPPCIECCKLMIQAGIVEVYYLEPPEFTNLSDKDQQTNWRDTVIQALILLETCDVSVNKIQL